MNVSPINSRAATYYASLGEVEERMHTTQSARSNLFDNEDKTRSSKALVVKPISGPVKKIIAEKMAEKKRRRQKKWKKPKDKPNRPLSAYNLFFQSERANMLGDDAPTDEEEALKKRVHCKTHGKIGFAEMAKNIGNKWKNLDPTLKKVYEDQARKEKDRYAMELEAWKAAQKNKSKGSRAGLDAIATAAMNCDPMDSSDSSVSSSSQSASTSSVRPSPSESLQFMMSQQQRNISLLHRQNDIEYLWALREQRQRQQAALLGRQHALLEYPCAAEASANAILQSFQGVRPKPQPASPLHAAAMARYDMAAAMRRVYMANDFNFTPGGDFPLSCI